MQDQQGGKGQITIRDHANNMKEKNMKENYGGMTVNERLYAAKKFDEFDETIEKKDIDKVISILKSVDLNDDNIYPILKFFGLKVPK